ncbi:MAG: ferritin family protein [Pseudomonadota bacterium]|jgi:rubrerythrin|nr:hypothetical protein JT55_13880 [Rhodovulum sp. NI22]MDY6857905.1 ferritin family protein [Pseudomonadota bacterium]
MKNVEEFLVYAIRLEFDAAQRCDELAEVMESFDNKDCARLFRTLAKFARLHLEDAKNRGGFRDLPDWQTYDFEWPEGESPEAAEIWAADPMLAKVDALENALRSEKRSHDFYKHIRDTTTDPEIRALAREFVEEEAEHVAILEGWLRGEEVLPAA